MTMQHRKGSFDGFDISRYVSVPRKSGGEVMIRDVAIRKRDNVADDLAIHINHLSMASRASTERIAADYPEFKPGWFCLRVMTGREFAVEKRLDDAGVETLVVRSNSYKVVRKKRVRIVPEKPVIKGYVLVRCLPTAAAMMGLLHVDDVIDVVGGAVRPWRAEMKSINRFKDLAANGKYDHREEEAYSFKVGEGVRVTDGPFASFPAVVTAVDLERFRVTVDVAIFGRSAPVDMDIAQIEKM